MAITGYPAILAAVTAGGVDRTRQSPLTTIALTFLAGAYIALGGLLAIRAGGMLAPEIWGMAGRLVFAATFPLGLLLVVLGGADLFTGNCLSVTAARLQGRISTMAVVRALLCSYVGNLVGALFVAWAMIRGAGMLFETVATPTGTSMPWAAWLVKTANAKTSLTETELFWRAVGCNWLVCLATYAAASAKDVGGKILALWFPIMGFVAIGFEHCIANMFFIPGALLIGADSGYQALVASGAAPSLNVTWSSFVTDNLAMVSLGNLVGGFVFVACFYCAAYGKAVKAAEK